MTPKERRVQLNNLLRTVTPTVYFQPPANVKMDYPCVVYHYVGDDTLRANNDRYITQREYSITVMDMNPDSTIHEEILDLFKSKCSLVSRAVVNNLNHTYLKLFH